ncbi:MAG TPA: 2-oxoacid:ferredoxin oxidoreductase subunit gamma [Firmicutes bacterium]|jgi:2-oxoglutarate ferredoxin oxidoreductase subunit gamma|nr:2-oxoacid:ferredoxin oxidoreductase subunit gamma [Bacillota bacterium]
MTHEMVCAGFGGQGVMLIGQLLAYGGMLEGKEVTWFPSYGPEMRGGTANCSVVISDQPVGSPIVAEPDGLIAMNGPSLMRFKGVVKPGGVIVYNASLIEELPEQPAGVRLFAVATNELAQEIGNDKVGNMVALGAFLGLSKVVGLASVEAALEKVLPERRHHLIPLNISALRRGWALTEG